MAPRKKTASAIASDGTAFAKALTKEASKTVTENGATALSSSLSSLLDFFGTMGVLRSRDEDDIIALFDAAFDEDPLHAVKALFNCRDVRGGLGERRTFRIILRHLALTHPEIVRANLPAISEYGRYDDYFYLFDTPVERDMLDLIYRRYALDLAALDSENYTKISLLGKWLPSENATSKTTRAMAKAFISHFGETPRSYRKNLSALRSALRVVERDMSSGSWDSIDYESVPSKAALNYAAAFARHDADRYSAYIHQVNEGTAKINSAVLYPYDLVHKYTNRPYFCDGSDIGDVDPTVEAQWKALPDYLAGTPNSFLVMVDTSGSMTSGRPIPPIDVSVGLGIYFAEHSTGPFAHKFITFTDTPRLVDIPQIDGKFHSLRDAVAKVLNPNFIGYNTNLESAFELVLNAAVDNNLTDADLPSAILVISDMEIDQFGSGEYNYTFTEYMKARFAQRGLTMPKLVYWNVDARSSTFHATTSDDVRFVSGASPTVFKGLCEHLGSSAIELMLSTLDDPRYDMIVLPD